MRTCFLSWALLGGLVLACGAPSEEPVETSPDRLNVILISIDTLRPDHLGCYGYDRPTSPALDKLCEDSVVFEQAIAHAPSTLHSHASILTSLLPHHHGASWSTRARLADECVTLAEVLHDEQYATAAFTGGGQMDAIFGLDQGFDSYTQPEASRFVGTVREATKWLDQHSSQPFFLFLHTYETHHPYAPAPELLSLFETEYSGSLPDEIGVNLLRAINRGEVEFDEADVEHIVATYDAEIRSMDQGLGQLVSYLEQSALYDNTMIVFTSDHGEEFNEHGSVGWHSHTLYDELLSVPLVVKFPEQKGAGTRVDTQVGGIDIAPTVLSEAGIQAPEQFSGKDLGLVLGGELGEERPMVSRMDRPPSNDIDSVRTSSWKLFRQKLYDLEVDPAEQWDTALNQPEVVEELEAARQAALESRPRCLGPQVVPTGKTLDELKALGYLQ